MIRSPLKNYDDLEWFEKRIDKSSGPDACWLWLGGTSSSGYGVVMWTVNGVRRAMGAHVISLYLQTGVMSSRGGPFVLHGCDNRICCNPSHLRHGTQSENIRDACKRGRWRPHTLVGEDFPFTRLTAEKVVSIRRRLKAGERPADLAREHGVNPSTIDCVRAGTTWKHLL